MEMQAQFQNAKQAARQQDFERAREILETVISQEPRNVEAWLLSAHVAESTEQATRCLQRVLRLDPENTVAQRNLLRIQKVSAPASAEEAAALQSAPASPPKPTAVIAKEKENKGWSGSERMLIGTAAFLLIAFACLIGGILIVVPQINSQTSQSIAEAGDPIETVRENIRASNAEDVERYMSTIHSRSPLYRSTRQALETVFDDYDLSYRLTNVELIEQDGEEARINFTIVTTKILGPPFADNRVTGEMIMRIEDGQWKIYDQETTEVDYLD